MNTKVAAITVTYNPSQVVLRKQMESLATQCPLVLVDNGSCESVLDEIECAVNEYEGVLLEMLGRNTGIAAAQNFGIEHARNLYPDCQYVLTLDQDSVPDLNMVETLVNCFSNLEKAGSKVAAVGPILYDDRSENYLNFHRIKGPFWWKVKPDPGGQAVNVDSLNSSGSLISLEALDSVGALNSDLFIDHVETEWCFRAKDADYSIFACQQTSMEHAMGDDVVDIRIVNVKAMPYRSPKRHYFIVRNSMFLQRQKYVPMVWKFWNTVKLVFTILYFGFFTKESAEHRRWIYKGLKDGWCLRLGKLPSAY